MDTKNRAIKSYLWGIRLVCILSGAAFAWVVYSVPPEKGWLWKMAFYATLFLFLSGLLVLFLNGIRKTTRAIDDQADRKFNMSFHQGVLLALLVVLLLFMQSLRMLVWWDGLMVVAGILLIELYFLTNNKV